MSFEIESFLPPWLPEIEAAISDAGGRLVIVGGFVRDCVLKYRPIDLDIEVYQIDGLERLKEILAPFGTVNQEGAFFGVVSLKVDESISQGHYMNRAEFALPRLESSTGPGHKDFNIVHQPNLSFTQAARRRDFTVNAMGYDLRTKQLLDPYHGQRDAERRELHAVSDAFLEDPLRVFRAMQFAGRYGLSIGKDVIEYSNQMDLSALSVDRVFRELGKLLVSSARPSFGLQWVQPLGVGRFLPELGALAENQAKWEIIMEETDHLVLTRPSSDYQSSDAYSHMLRAILNAIPKAEQLRFLHRFVPNKKVISSLIPSASFRRLAYPIEDLYDVGQEPNISFDKNEFQTWQQDLNIKKHFIGAPDSLSVKWGNDEKDPLTLSKGMRLFALELAERDNMRQIGIQAAAEEESLYQTATPNKVRPSLFIWQTTLPSGESKLYYAYKLTKDAPISGGEFYYGDTRVTPKKHKDGQLIDDPLFPLGQLIEMSTETVLPQYLIGWKAMLPHLQQVNTQGEMPINRLPESGNGYIMYLTETSSRPLGSVNIIMRTEEGYLFKNESGPEGTLGCIVKEKADNTILKVAADMVFDEEERQHVFRFKTNCDALILPNGSAINFKHDDGTPIQFASVADLAMHFEVNLGDKALNTQRRQLSVVQPPRRPTMEQLKSKRRKNPPGQAPTPPPRASAPTVVANPAEPPYLEPTRGARRPLPPPPRKQEAPLLRRQRTINAQLRQRMVEEPAEEDFYSIFSGTATEDEESA